MKRWIKEIFLSFWLVCKLRSREGCVALTFDDGPHPVHTSKVLDMLKKHGAFATFFLVGDNIIKYPALVTRILDEGHEVANHSMTHPEFCDLSIKQIEDEINRCDEFLYRSGFNRKRRPIIRTPKGVIDLKVLMFCLKHRRRVYLWNRDPKDYKATSEAEILDFFDSGQLHQGDIILMHDKTSYTPIALDKLLSKMTEQGLHSVTLSQY